MFVALIFGSKVVTVGHIALPTIITHTLLHSCMLGSVRAAGGGGGGNILLPRNVEQRIGQYHSVSGLKGCCLS